LALLPLGVTLSIIRVVVIADTFVVVVVKL
jgi:hypothetical protein